MAEEKLEFECYVLNVDQNCQDVYDESESLMLDEHGNLTYDSNIELGRIKLEAMEDNSAIMEGDINPLGEAPQFEMMQGLEVENFNNTLMQELDSEIMNINKEIDDKDIIEINMDIREPLTKLKSILENKFNKDLTGFIFSLQDEHRLDEKHNLVEQCAQEEGMVQINVQILSRLCRINIVDVMKTSEQKVMEQPENEEPNVDVKNVSNWEANPEFKRQQEKLHIPNDPKEWTVFHVRHWIQWAVRHFNLPNVKLSSWNMDGKQLVNLSTSNFRRLIPRDPQDLFWTHLELLRQVKIVATKKTDVTKCSSNKKTSNPNKVNRIMQNYPSPLTDVNLLEIAANRSGNNGQTQLWQFLLELLEDERYKQCIGWVPKDRGAPEGSFILHLPHIVAQLWGARKNKPKMNYEKLSRALRYYYENKIVLAKVSGKRFTYQFIFDFTKNIGYSATELANLVDYRNPCGLVSMDTTDTFG